MLKGISKVIAVVVIAGALLGVVGVAWAVVASSAVAREGGAALLDSPLPTPVGTLPPDAWGSVIEPPPIQASTSGDPWWATYDCGVLWGKQVFVVVWVQSPGYSPYTQAEKDHAMLMIDSAGWWMEYNASQYGAQLTTDLVEQYSYTCSTDPAASQNAWWDCVWEIMGYTGSWGESGPLSISRLKAAYKADEVALVWHYQGKPWTYDSHGNVRTYYAYSMYGGPHEVVVQDMMLWADLDRYYFHETMHHCHAPDQYLGDNPPCWTDDGSQKGHPGGWGPWRYLNWNSEIGTWLDPDDITKQDRGVCPEHVPGIMASEFTYSVDPWTAAHVGWKKPQPQYWPTWQLPVVSKQYTEPTPIPPTPTVRPTLAP